MFGFMRNNVLLFCFLLKTNCCLLVCIKLQEKGDYCLVVSLIFVECATR